MNWKATYRLLVDTEKERGQSHWWGELLGDGRSFASADDFLAWCDKEFGSVAQALAAHPADEVKARVAAWRLEIDAMHGEHRDTVERVMAAVREAARRPAVFQGPYHLAAHLVVSRDFWGVVNFAGHLRPDELDDLGPRTIRETDLRDVSTKVSDSGQAWRQLSHLFRGVNSVRKHLVPPIYRNFKQPSGSCARSTRAREYFAPNRP